MLQQTLVVVTFEKGRKSTRRELFIDEIDRVVLWTELGR